MRNLKVAFVYDRVNKIGGAERVLGTLHEIWPEAPLYTAVYNPRNAKWASVFRVHPSFINHIPFAATHHEWLPWLTPMAFESFSFDEYDLVLSVTSAEAKNIITKPKTVHICYCLTPTRYLWSAYEQYRQSSDIGLPDWTVRSVFHRIAPTLRRWDQLASRRPDAYIAISKTVSNRILSYYHRKTDAIIYPPVDTHMFTMQTERNTEKSGSYFLTVARLVGYKRLDIVVDAFNRLELPLIIIGDGWERKALQNKSKSNIRIFPSVSEKELVKYYQNSRAFVFAGEEDFGIAAVEAQASGKPVIAYARGGISEIVQDGKTGILFQQQTTGSLVDALKKFERSWYDSRLCKQNALRFSKERFKKTMKSTVEVLYNTYI